MEILLDNLLVSTMFKRFRDLYSSFTNKRYMQIFEKEKKILKRKKAIARESFRSAIVFSQNKYATVSALPDSEDCYLTKLVPPQIGRLFANETLPIVASMLPLV